MDAVNDDNGFVGQYSMNCEGLSAVDCGQSCHLSLLCAGIQPRGGHGRPLRRSVSCRASRKVCCLSTMSIVSIRFVAMGSGWARHCGGGSLLYSNSSISIKLTSRHRENVLASFWHCSQVTLRVDPLPHLCTFVSSLSSVAHLFALSVSFCVG